jgi:hypothetical protein
VPWCDTCDRFYNPNSLQGDGTCPTCGRPVATAEQPGEPAEVHSGAPWHFKVLVAVTAVYLGYRLFQGVFWVAHHL